MSFPSFCADRCKLFALSAVALAVASASSLAAGKIVDDDYTFTGTEAIDGVEVNAGNSSTLSGSNILVQSGTNVGISAKGEETNLATVNIGLDKTLSVRVESNFAGTGAAGANLIYNANATVLGQTIEFVNAGDSTAATLRLQGQGDKLIGNENTKSIHVANKGYYGLVVLNTNNAVSKLTAEEISIESHMANGSAIHVQNSVTDETGPGRYATLRLEADKIYLTADTGITALSHADVTVIGDTVIDSLSAIVTRGDSKVSINADGKHTTQITGNVSFNYDKETSGSGINSSLTINLNGENSYWTGIPMTVCTNGEKPENADLLQVKDFYLTVANGAQWNADQVENKNYSQHSVEETALDHLELNNGFVNVHDAEHHLKVEQLTGTGGTVNLTAQVADDGTITSAKFAVTDETSAKDTKLVANLDGITADDVTVDAAETALANSVSYAGETEGRVAEGDIRGAISTKIVNGKVQEGSTKQVRNEKLHDLVGVNASALVQWRNEINHLTKRMGDLRSNSGEVGAWARVYGGESNWDSNSVEVQTTTVQVGGDYKIADDWIVGGAFSYTDSSIDVVRGEADGESFNLAAYATRMADNGVFMDFVARYGYLKNEVHSGNMNIDLASNAFSLSGEVGHHFAVTDGAYVEPQIELTYGYVTGDDETASNGVKVDQDNFQSLVGRLGVRAGFDFPQKAGTLYAMASYSYEFLGEVDGTASKGNDKESLNTDLDGGWFTYGIGAQFMIGDSAYAYGELERTTGGEVENPYRFNVGCRWMF